MVPKVVVQFGLASLVMIYGSPLRAEPPVRVDGEAFPKFIVPFFEKYCVDCHGKVSAKGGFSLTEFVREGPRLGADRDIWLSILERVATGNMPPEKRPQPTRVEVAKLGGWIRGNLVAMGHGKELEFPQKGNLVSHELLFGASANLGAKPATPMRIWRVTPWQYEGTWVGAKILSPPLGANAKPGQVTTFHRERREIPPPFNLRGGTGFQDFAALYRIDEAETEQLLLNAAAIANKLLGAQAGKGGGGEVARQAPKAFLDLFNGTGPPSEAQVEAALKTSFQSVLHRDPSIEEAKSYLQFWKAQIEKFGRQTGLKNGVAAVILHPESLFRLELGDGKPDAQGRVMLAPRELAFAIAFALGDTPPDGPLLEALASGRLRSREDVEREVRRLLNDPTYAKPRVLRFFQEYFGYAAAATVFKDGKVFGSDQFALLVKDTDRLVLAILESDQEVLKELLTTRQGFNTGASSFGKGQKAEAAYGYPAGVWDKPFVLPADQRAGILTQPSWLLAHSAAAETDAVRRGKWVRERLLGDAIPDVPITVEAQLPDEPDKTMRERMRVTRAAFCWQCHQRMDPLGLAFEMYDDWGRFRTREMLGEVPPNSGKRPAKKVDTRPNVPVDSSGEIMKAADPSLDGPVNNALELVNRLAKSDHVHQVFVRHAFRYWMGRNETPEDAPTLQAAYQAYRKSGGSMKALIASLLTSDSFLYRREVKE